MCLISKDSTAMRLDVGQASIIGTREEQQDAVLLENENGSLLAAVCDGMGGLNNGSQASRITIETLRTLHKEKEASESYSDFYLRAVDILDESVWALRRLGGNRTASGTTIVSTAIIGNQLFWLSVGDSRLYLIRDDEIVCVTTDHNYNLLLDQAYQAGKITESEYKTEMKKGGALVSYIGMGGIDLFDMNRKPFLLQPEDIALLMSDGLYRCISAEEMLRIAKNAENAQDAAARLVAQSQMNAKGSQDNTSVIVIKMNGARKV